MRRTKLVLAAVAVMVAMLLVALSAPAMADDGRDRHNDGRNHHNAWNNHNNWNDRDHHNKFDRFDRFDHDRNFFFVNDLDDDCEWEFEEGWFFGFWGWQWGWWFLDC